MIKMTSMNNKGQPGNNWKETDAEREAEERVCMKRKKH